MHFPHPKGLCYVGEPTVLSTGSRQPGQKTVSYVDERKEQLPPPQQEEVLQHVQFSYQVRFLYHKHPQLLKET